MNLRVPWNVGNFLTSCKPVNFSRRTLHHGVSKYRRSVCSVHDFQLLFSFLTMNDSLRVEKLTGNWNIRDTLKVLSPSYVPVYQPCDQGAGATNTHTVDVPYFSGKISSHLRNTNFSFLHYVNEYVTALRQSRWGNRRCLPRLPPRQCFLIGHNYKSHVGRRWGKTSNL